VFIEVFVITVEKRFGDKMVKAKFNLKHKEVLDTFLLDMPFVKPGKMYGHPAYYVGGKLFASLYMEGVCVKVPESLKKELKLIIQHYNKNYKV